MVLKYIDGVKYREPPYTEEELADLEWRIYQPPVTILWGSKPLTRTTSELSQESPQQEKPQQEKE